MNTKLSLLLTVSLSSWLGILPSSAQVADHRDLAYPSLPKFEIPKPEVYTLSNGMEVFLMQDRELPLIQVIARVKTGSYYEPADKVGLASLMGIVQRTGGTLRMAGDEIDDFLAARAASIETGIGGDSGSARMDCLKQDFDAVFAVFSDILRKPAFAQEKLDLAKISANTSIARRNDNVSQITSREVQRLVYGSDSPLARITEYATIKAITRDDLVNWHRRFYLPNRVILGVVGDFEAADMKLKIESVLGDWQKGSAVDLPPVEHLATPVSGYYHIEKDDINQANITMAHLGIERKNPDFFPVQIMNEILGGGFASRMFSNVRSRQGLAYSVYGQLGAEFGHPGLFRAGLQTQFGNTTKAIQAVKAEIQGMIAGPPTEAELKRAKDSILNSFVFNYDSKGKILAQQMSYAYYGLPADYLDQYRGNIEKVTAADVHRVASKYLHPDQLAVLVVGKAAEFDRPLSELGNVKSVDISIPPPPDAGPKIEKSALRAEEGRRVWSSVVKAMGGDELKKISAVEVTMNSELKMGGQSMALKQVVTVVFPDQIRQVMSLPMGEQTVVIDADEAWALVNGQHQPLPPAIAQEQKQEMGRNLVQLLRNYDDPSLDISSQGKENVEGVACEIIAVAWKGAESRLWVAPDGTVSKQTYKGNNPVTRVPGTIEIAFSDYRLEGSIRVAYKQNRRVDGQELMSTTIESFKLDPKVDPAWFKKPTE